MGALWTSTKQRADLFKHLPPQNLAFDGQSTSLVVGKQNPLPTVRLLQDLIFAPQVVNHDLLLAIDPARENDEVQLPEL